jgi:hypothetical protein
VVGGNWKCIKTEERRFYFVREQTYFTECTDNSTDV